MKDSVSIIIPCYNAEKWLREAIDSCLQQTYSPIEIIVIDDGSTDNSLEIIKSYGDKLIWETGKNRGGNYARNRGFALSKGKYIQYLDADDYILPEKIEKQVYYLEETGADVVYGDWRFQYHLPKGKISLSEINICGPHEDFLEFLISGQYPWLTTIVPLFRRAVVANSQGWDENIKSGQDRDFFISIALKNAKIFYQPGCYSIHRKYGNITVSTSNKARWLEQNLLIMAKTEKKLADSHRLSLKYRKALARSYFTLITYWCSYLGYSNYTQILYKVRSLDQDFEPSYSKIYRLFYPIFKFYIAGVLFKFLKDFKYVFTGQELKYFLQLNSIKV
ncbi:glycosyltransferase family 2 protein [Limnoraphis robusta]|uniref:Glycosyltransferase 2-like domain-containing protein n=2 Tax=Limnoraphis TaxID=1332112 RepID=A0A0J9EUK0_9CYAN|nr:glycosyltransferase [Limnoraphis robusta]KMW69958.1 hypothetical protein WN50_39065 [Limnoraphis robusta CS-951]